MELFGWRKFAEHIGFVLASLGLVLLGVVQGFQSYSFTVDFFSVIFEILLIDAVASSFFFTAFLLISGSLFFWNLRSSKPVSNIGDEDSVACIIPTYKDSEALHNSVDSLLGSNYGNFEVFIVCEEDDKKGIEAARGFSEDDRVDYLVNSKYPGSKAGAINFAVEETDSDVIAIFDSDQRINRNFLSQAVGLLENSEVVQGRHLPRPGSLIESLAYYESLIFSYVIRQPLNMITGFRLIGSRATMIERSVFEQLEGYSSETLTEDYDFAHKCYRAGIKTDELLLEPVNEEAAHSITDWWCQRKRWMTGYFEVFSKTSKLVFKDFKGYRSLLSLLISGGSIIGSILMLTLVSKFVILFLIGADAIYLIPLCSILLISLAGRFYDSRAGHLENIGWSWTLTPLIFPLFSLITIKAFFEFLLNPDTNWYRVQK